MDKKTIGKEGDKLNSDNALPEESSDSDSSEDETESSFDEDDVSEDFVPEKRPRRRGRAAGKGKKTINSKLASSETSSNSSTRKTRLSQKLEDGIPLHLTSELQSAYRVLDHLMSDFNQSYNFPFMDDVDLNLRENRNYSVVVEKPMCLNTVKRKLLSKDYVSVTDVIRDVRLIFENCYRFYGASHSYSKKGFRLEAMMEHKLAQLSRDLRDKSAIAVTSPDLVKGIDLKELTNKAENRSPADASMVMGCVKNHIESQEEEERKMLQKEKDEEKDPAYLEILEWENKLIGENHTVLKAMWELPQIGHFLFLAQDVLNIPEVSQFELERAFFMPQASSLLSTIMTALLSNPKQRNKLSGKPPMPYKIWHERLKAKLQTWYKLYYAKERNVLKVLNIIGIEPPFFRIMGDVNPLEKCPFHELGFYEKVWIVKSLCDFCLHSHKSVHEAIFMGDPLDHREVVLGEDMKGNTYLHFPQFCGPDLRVYRQASCPEPSAPDLSCPPIVKDIIKSTTEPSQSHSNQTTANEKCIDGDHQIANLNSQESPCVTDEADACGNEKFNKKDSAEKLGKSCDNSMPAMPLSNGVIAESDLCSEKENNISINVSEHSGNSEKERDNQALVPNGEINSELTNSTSCEDSITKLKTVSHNNDCNAISEKPKLIMKFKKEKCENEDSCILDSDKKRKTKLDVFTICNSDESKVGENDLTDETRKDIENTDVEDHCDIVTQKRLRSSTKTKEEKESLNHVISAGSNSITKDPKLGAESEKHVDKPKKSPAKASDCHSLESTWIGSRKKGKRGRKSRAVPMVISYDGVASKPNIDEFELVVNNLDSLRELTNLFIEKEQPTQRTRKKKEPQQKSNSCEKALHKRLCNLIKELDAWELTLLQSTKSARLRMKKEWEEYQIKASLKEEEDCKDIWGSEEEDEEEEIRDSSSSSSNSEDEYEDLGDATSFRQQHLRQCTRRKRVRGEDDPNSVSVSSENSNSSDPFQISVSSRGRIRKMRRLDYEDLPVRKVSPKPKRQYIVLNGIQPDQRNMLEAHRIQNSAQDAKMQYQWETMRQQLLEDKQKKAAQKVCWAPGEPKPMNNRPVTPSSNTTATQTTSTPRLLPHYGGRVKTKSDDDSTTLVKEQGTPSYHLQHVLMSQPSFGSMKSMKSNLSPDESFFDDPQNLGFPQFMPDFTSTNRPFVPPPQKAISNVGKKKAAPPPKIIRTESKNIGTRLLQTSYTAPGILKTTVGSKMLSPPRKEATTSTVFVKSSNVAAHTTVKPHVSQVVRLQLPSSFANASGQQQKRVVLVPFKDQKGGNRFILKVYPSSGESLSNTTNFNTASSTVVSNTIASTSGSQVSQTMQSNPQKELRNVVHLNSNPPPLGPICQTFQTNPSSKSPIASSVSSEPPPLALIVPQQTVSASPILEPKPNMELINSPITTDVVFPTQQQVVISQPMVVPCTMQLQPSSTLLGQQHVVCTSDINGLLQFGKQLVISQPSSVATSNNIVLLTNNNQVISSTLNMSGS